MRTPEVIFHCGTAALGGVAEPLFLLCGPTLNLLLMRPAIQASACATACEGRDSGSREVIVEVSEQAQPRCLEQATHSQAALYMDGMVA
jgi:hypothetical protein